PCRGVRLRYPRYYYALQSMKGACNSKSEELTAGLGKHRS
ncbi:hypothetical protein C5167_015831, partial [Papaver somniferum]